jgi:hypothetical protein
MVTLGGAQNQRKPCVLQGFPYIEDQKAKKTIGFHMFFLRRSSKGNKNQWFSYVRHTLSIKKQPEHQKQQIPIVFVCFSYSQQAHQF